MIKEKDFFSATKRLTVVEGDVSYPYIEIVCEDSSDTTSFEFFTKDKLEEVISYLVEVKERWS